LFNSLILAYFGPETFLPLTSIVAAIVGVAMMCGRNTIRFLLYLAGRIAPGRGASDSKGRRQPGQLRRGGAGASRRDAAASRAAMEE
jgi:hypothetical protein